MTKNKQKPIRRIKDINVKVFGGLSITPFLIKNKNKPQEITKHESIDRVIAVKIVKSSLTSIRKVPLAGN